MAEEKSAPTKPKKLTPEQAKKVSEWIERHSKGGCPVCGHRKWKLAPDLVEIRPYYGITFLGGPIYPLVLLTCENCGYVFLFHAMMTGALDTAQEKDK